MNRSNISSFRISDIDVILHCYVDIVVNSFGFLLSIFSYIVLLNSKFKENLYNYIRMDVLSSAIILSCFGLRSILFCNCSELNSYYTLLISIIIRYIRFVFSFSSIIYVVISSIYFYLKISNQEKSKFNILNKYSYKFVSFFIIIFSCILFLFIGFEEDIIKFESNNSTELFYYRKNVQFFRSNLRKITRYISFILNHIIMIIILILTNILIYLKVKNIMKKKRYVIQRSASSETNIERTERSIKLMLYVGNLNEIICRLPIMVYFIFEEFVDDDGNKSTMLIISSYVLYFLISLSYSIKFFLYYLTNILFRQVFNDYLNMFIRLFIKHINCVDQRDIVV